MSMTVAMDYLIELEESDEELGTYHHFLMRLGFNVGIITHCPDAKLQSVERLTFVCESIAFPLKHFTQVCPPISRYGCLH